MLGIIKRAFKHRDKETMLKLYKAFVRPHLEYANVVWCPFLKRQSVTIERVQRRATRLMGCSNLSYEARLKYLHLYSLKGRRIRGDLIQTYKIFQGIDRIDCDSFFSSAPTGITRNSEGKLFVNRCKTNKRKFYYSNCVVQLIVEFTLY